MNDNRRLSIGELADLLTEPQISNEPIPYWDNNRNRKIRRHRIILPGLLAQLYQSVLPTSSSDEPATGGVPGSRPPLAVEALSIHAEIKTAVTRWCDTLHLTRRNTVESNIRNLVGHTSRLDHDQTHQLHADLRHWYRWAAVYIGWERIHIPRGRIPCPIVDCTGVNTLRINLTTETALCTACGATWSTDDGNLGLLADYIRKRLEADTPTTRAAGS